MNNFFLPNNDPLLFNNQTPQYLQQEFQQKMEQKYNDYLMRSMQQSTPDKLYELDQKMKSLSPELVKMLNEDVEFNDLSTELQSNIHNELMLLIKQRVNSNQETIKNIDRQLVIIKNLESKVNEDERKNLSELNDYLKNYSNMTFDDYKKLKNQNNENTRI